MKLEKAPGYWPTLIMLGAAVLAVGLQILLAPALLWPGFEPMIDPRGAFFGVPPREALYIASVGLSLTGLARMVRVYRGPRDEPSQWRYRDR